MYNYPLSLICGFIGMAFAVSSYFVRKKTMFLTCQAGAVIALALSCLFIEQYFAVVSYFISIVRIWVYYIRERQNKPTQNWVKCIFGGLVIVSYVIINIVILQDFKLLDVMFMIAGVMYAFVFGIRNLMVMRYVFLIPTIMTLIYYVLINATVFVIISYAFELCANIVAIILYSKTSKAYKRAKLK